MIFRPVTPASPCGPPDDEAAGGVDVDLRVAVHHLGGDHAVDDGLDDVGAHRLVRDVRTVLARNHDGVDPHRRGALIFHRDLRLAVRPEVPEHSVAPRARKALGQLVGEHDRERHQLLGFRARVAEHQPLVAGAARVHPHRDVGGLAVDGRDDRTGVGVEAELAARVPDVGDRLAHHVLVVDDGVRRDLAGDEGDAGRDERLAGHAALRVLREDGIEDRIRDLVGDLVRVTFRDRFRREEVPSATAHAGSLTTECQSTNVYTNI